MLAVLLLLDGDVAHGGRGRRAVPVLLARLEPDHVPPPDILDGPALALDPAAAGGDDQRLAERVGVPGRARAGLEGDQRHRYAGWLGRAVERIDPHPAGEILFRPLPDGCEPLRFISTAFLLRCSFLTLPQYC